MKIYTFALNESESLVFQLDDEIDKVFAYEDYPIFFIAKNKKYTIIYDCLHYSLEKFINILTDVLNNKLTIDESIKDIGIARNEYFHKKSLLFDTKSEKIEALPILQSSLYSSAGNAKPVLDTWLYNETNGNIIFKITPNYPWHFRDPEKGEKYISYEEFMKNYKPIITQTVPQKVAQEWLEKAQRLLLILDDNYRRIAERYKAQQPKE